MENELGIKVSQAIVPAGSITFRLAVDANELLNVVSSLSEKEKDGVDLISIQAHLGDTASKLSKPAIHYLLGEAMKSGHLIMEDGKYKMAPKHHKTARSAGKKKSSSRSRKSSPGKKRSGGTKKMSSGHKKAGASKKKTGKTKKTSVHKKAGESKRKSSAHKKTGGSKRKSSGSKRKTKKAEEHPM